MTKNRHVFVGTERLLLMLDIQTFAVTKEMDSHTNMIHNIIRVDDHIWTCSSDKTLKVWSLTVCYLYLPLSRPSRSSSPSCLSLTRILQ